MKNVWEFSWQKLEWQKNDKTERVRGLGRKNEREEIKKEESNDSPEIPGRRTSYIYSLPSGHINRTIMWLIMIEFVMLTSSLFWKLLKKKDNCVISLENAIDSPAISQSETKCD